MLLILILHYPFIVHLPYGGDPKEYVVTVVREISVLVQSTSAVLIPLFDQQRGCIVESYFGEPLDVGVGADCSKIGRCGCQHFLFA